MMHRKTSIMYRKTLKNYCKDDRVCFARTHSIYGDLICSCLAIVDYKNHECPFCKPRREYTKGEHYPYNEGLLDHLSRKEAVGNVEN